MLRVAILVAAVVPLAAQPGRGPRPVPQPPQETPVYQPQELCVVAGIVRSKATGEPIRKASVTLISIEARGRPGFGGLPSAAVTDASGRFVFTGVTPGRYRLGASRNGFVTQNYGSGGGTPVALAKGQRVDNLEFRLTPHGVVTGHVWDEDGDPVAHAGVQVMRFVYTDQGKALRTAGAAQTNDLGEFRVFGIPPGRYFVQATQRQLPVSTPIESGRPSEGYAATFYPGVTEPGTAMPVEVAQGAVAQGVDIRLAKTQTFRVAGRVTGGPGDGRPGMVTLVRRTGSTESAEYDWAMFRGRNASWDPRKGTFTLAGVPPGAYTLMAQLASRSERWSAVVAVDVAADIANLEVALQPGQEVSGRIRVEGQEDAASPQQIQVTLDSPGSRLFGTPPGQVNAEGEFTIHGVAAGTYRLVVAGLPAGHYVKSIRAGERDVLTNGIEVAGGAPLSGVDILLSPKAAGLAGTVTGRGGEPAGGATVVLIPPAGHPRRSQLMLRITADQSGLFQFGDVPPGEYRLYAFTGAEDGEDRDPDLLARHDSDAGKVTLAESSHESRTVKEIPLRR